MIEAGDFFACCDLGAVVHKDRGNNASQRMLHLLDAGLHHEPTGDDYGTRERYKTGPTEHDDGSDCEHTAAPAEFAGESALEVLMYRLIRSERRDGLRPKRCNDAASLAQEDRSKLRQAPNCNVEFGG